MARRFLTPIDIPPVDLVYAATIVTDASRGTHFRCVLTGDTILGVPTNPTDGQLVMWELTASGAARTPTLSTAVGGFAFGTDITALTAIASGTTDFIGARYRASVNKWRVLAVAKGY